MSSAESKRYQRCRIRVHIAELAVSAAFLAVLQFSGISVVMRDASLALAGSFYPALAVYFLIFSLSCYVITLPIDFYAGFILEHRFAVSNQSGFRWLTEEAKKAVLSFVMTLFLVEALYAIGRSFPAAWWLIASAFWLFFSVGIAKIFPAVILPIFYTYAPLANDDLKRRVLELAGKFAIKVVDVSEIDFSKNTKKSNAAVIGWGKAQRVILADNLVKDFTADEVEVVVAHEMAHYKLAHIRKLVLVHAASTLFFFFCLSHALPAVAAACGATGPFDMAALPAVALLFGIYGFAVTPLVNAYSRKLEREADREALRITGNKGAFISLMKRFAVTNLSDENPHPAIEYLFYDHPPIGKRIRMAERYAPQ